MRLFSGLMIFLLVAASASAFAVPHSKSDPARVHVYIFKQGEPVRDIELVEGERTYAYSDNNGAIHQRLDAGPHKLELRWGNALLAEINLSLQPHESVQIIANLPEAGNAALISMESSSKGKPQLGGDAAEGKAATATPVNDGQKTAEIFGQVTSLEGGNPIPGAQVYISGLRDSIRTDANGEYRIQLVPGLYSMSVVHADFSTQVFDEFAINDQQHLQKDIELTPSGLELEEFVVSAPDLEGGIAALADERRNTSAVVEVIGAEQMSAAGDSDAAGALKRVTGLTVVDGKYVYVRGLGDRYSSTTMNGAILPSPDPTRRVVPLDLIPTGVLGSVLIQKTFSPNMPGEFGGGTVQLRTRGLPEDKFKKISISTEVNSQTTFQEGLGYDGGSVDFLGVDDGTRAMPDTLYNLTDGGSGLLTGLSPEEIEAAGESLPVKYATYPVILPPDMGAKFSLGDRFEDYDGNWGWGYLFSFQYKNEWQQRDEYSATFGQTGRGDLVMQDEVFRKLTENEINLGGMLHLGLEWGNYDSYESTTLLTRQTTDRVVQDTAYYSENDINAIDTTLEWVETQLLLQQFQGSHLFPRWHDLGLDWLATASTATRYEPGTRFYRYEADQDGVYAFSREGQSNETSYEDLVDNNLGFNVNFSLPFYDFLGSTTTVKFGFLAENKQRESSFSRFRLLTDFSRNNIRIRDLYAASPDTILDAPHIGPDGYKLRNTTLPTDNYTAQQVISSQYLMANMDYERFKVMAGTRLEYSRQAVDTFKLTDPSQVTRADLETTDLLPALSFSWAVSPSLQFRAAYSDTLNRPDFKELSEAPYIDPDTRRYVIGNPNLQRALISNYDLRAEWYMTKFEVLSLAFFYKDFSQPIEQVWRSGNGGFITFANADSAQNYGVEFQGRSWMSRLLGRSFSRFYIEGNLSLIKSSVDLGDAVDLMTNQERPLQGQSPWVVNLSLGYENLISATRAVFLFNMAGERITSVGVKGMPDAYEQPAPLLDFVFSRRIYEGTNGKKAMVKFRVKNILDPEFQTLRGEEVERLTKKGTSYKLTLSYSFI